MLTVTENAATIIKGILSSVEKPERAGLRIGPRSGTSNLGIEIASAPALGDAVIDDGGVRVYLDEVAAPQLANRELDASIAGEEVRFVLRDQD